MIQASPRRPVRPAWPTRALLMLLLAVPGPTLWAQPADTPRDNHGGVPGLNAFMLEPSLWASFVPQPDRQMLSRAGIDAQNARMRAEDTSIHDLRALPATLPRARVRADIQALSRWPEKALFGEDGKPVAASARAAIEANLGLDTIPAERPLQYGLVTHRAALRAFPTALRVFTTQGDTDIDRFQETALFP
ncbi:MAG: SH3 domain-containing protein, partial [Stenotrophomonas sp.]